MPQKLVKSPSRPSDHSQAIAPKTCNDSLTQSVLLDRLPLPAMIVFDLDYTLWPFYSDVGPAAPLRPVAGSHPATSTLSDRNGEHFSFYPDVFAILHTLAGTGIKLGVASKSPVEGVCRDILDSLRLPDPGNKDANGSKAIDVFGAGLEIYPITKLRHFEVLAKRTGVDHHDMLFFDDERPNKVVETLGVTMCLVKDGLTWAELEKGIVQWRQKRGKAKSMASKR